MDSHILQRLASCAAKTRTAVSRLRPAAIARRVKVAVAWLVVELRMRLWASQRLAASTQRVSKGEAPAAEEAIWLDYTTLWPGVGGNVAAAPEVRGGRGFSREGWKLLTTRPHPSRTHHRPQVDARD